MSLVRRVERLAGLYRAIAATRMAGVPLCNPRLQVAALGFEPLPDGAALGVLATPWFMNLVWLPPEPMAADSPPPLRVGDTRARPIGAETFDFIGAFEDGFGPFEACSLFSPMAEFADQAAVLATAEVVLSLLRQPTPPSTPAAAPPPAAEPVPARRRFLLGARTAAL